MPVTNLIPVKIVFIATKNRIGPITKPSVAKEAAIVENKGAKQNCDKESPIPARGPISAILIPRISSSGRSLSSIAKCKLVTKGKK